MCDIVCCISCLSKIKAETIKKTFIQMRNLLPAFNYQHVRDPMPLLFSLFKYKEIDNTKQYRKLGLLEICNKKTCEKFAGSFINKLC